jgi:hypothetical protein
MQIVYYFITAMVGFSIIFFVVYSVNNPLEQPSSKVKYPYFLSVKPHLVSEQGLAQIYFSSINKTTPTNKLTLVILDPFGKKTIYGMNESDNQSFQFPKIPTFNFLPLGNYSVILQSNNNQSLNSIDFKVVPYAPLNAFASFAFGVGIPLTIGLAVTIISTAFQFAFTLNSDRNRKFQEKSKWMIDNAKYFVSLSIYSDFISSKFRIEHEVTVAPDSKFDLLYYMIMFLQSYYKYLEQIGFYYLYDLASEDFAAKLDGSILELYDCIFGDRRVLKDFFGIEKYVLIKNESFCEYSNEIYQWLASDQSKCKAGVKPLKEVARRPISNAYRFYITHLVYSRVLSMSVNDLERINYTNPKVMKKRILEDVKDEKRQLKEGIDYLNRLYYEDNEQKYYKLTFAAKDLLNPSPLDSVVEGINREITS